MRIGRAQNSPLTKAFFQWFGWCADSAEASVSTLHLAGFVRIMADFVPFGGPNLLFPAN
jgi:hypothetical protein